MAGIRPLACSSRRDPGPGLRAGDALDAVAWPAADSPREEGYKVRAFREQFKELKPGETEIQLGAFFPLVGLARRRRLRRRDRLCPETGASRRATIRARAVRFQFTDTEVFVSCRTRASCSARANIANENRPSGSTSTSS
jgi:hypothetical protein